MSNSDPFRSFETSPEIVRLAVMMCIRVLAKINGKRRYLGRTTDREGEVPEAYVTKYGNNGAPKKFVRKLMKRHGQADEVIPDRFASFEFTSRRHSSVDLPKSNTLGRSIDFLASPVPPNLSQRVKCGGSCFMRLRYWKKNSRFECVISSKGERVVCPKFLKVSLRFFERSELF